MRINIEEIKKLPVDEKLRIIEELWESMSNEIETEEDIILRERLEAYERGEMSFVSWEETKTKIEQRLNEMRSARK
ncbi:MAG: addiction module protein [Flavisolibacter sp.]|nr:addiction module protein [Flavisolibacter sp.]